MGYTFLNMAPESCTKTYAWNVWIWQFSLINHIRKRYCRGWLGFYRYEFQEDGQLCECINYIHIRPFFWRAILWHERGHQTITHRCKNAIDAGVFNHAWDNETWHGLLFWKKP